MPPRRIFGWMTGFVEGCWCSCKWAWFPFWKVGIMLTFCPAAVEHEYIIFCLCWEMKSASWCLCFRGGGFTGVRGFVTVSSLIDRCLCFFLEKEFLDVFDPFFLFLSDWPDADISHAGTASRRMTVWSQPMFCGAVMAFLNLFLCWSQYGCFEWRVCWYNGRVWSAGRGENRMGRGGWLGTDSAALQSGRIDAMCATIWATPQRGKFIGFTRPLFYSTVEAIARADDGRFDNNLAAINRWCDDFHQWRDVSEKSRPRGFSKSQSFAKAQIAGAQLCWMSQPVKSILQFTNPSVLRTFNATNQNALCLFLCRSLYGNMQMWWRLIFMRMLCLRWSIAVWPDLSATGLLTEYLINILRISRMWSVVLKFNKDAMVTRVRACSLSGCGFRDGSDRGGVREGTEDEAVWLLEHPPLYCRNKRQDRGSCRCAVSCFREWSWRGHTYHGPDNGLGMWFLILISDSKCLILKNMFGN